MLDRPLAEAEQVLRGRWRLDLGEALSCDEALELAFSTSPANPLLAVRFLRVAVTDGDPFAQTVLAQRLIAAGELQEAEELLRAAAATGGEEVRVAALLALATGIGSGRSADALVELDQALVEHPDEVDLLAIKVALLLAEARSEEAAALAAHVATLPAPGASAVLGESTAQSRWRTAATGRRRALLGRAALARNIRASRRARCCRRGWRGRRRGPSPAARAPRTGIPQRGYDRTPRGPLRPDRARFAHLLAAGRLVQGEAVLAARLLREAEAAPCFWCDSKRPEIIANLVEALVLGGEQQEAERTYERLDHLSAHRSRSTTTSLRGRPC